MKKSNLKNFFAPNTHGMLLERYEISKFIDEMRSFISMHHGESIKIESRIENISYINIIGRKTAEFIAHVVKLRRGSESLRICMEDMYDMFNILIYQEGGALSISEEEKCEIIILARGAGFYVNIDDTVGAIIIKCDLQSPDTVTFGAIDPKLGFYQELKAAFDRAEEAEK